MKIAVCVKYVPVVARMGFDYENKTIIREGVPSEVNPFDLLGLTKAVQLKTGPEDEVMVLSMGPPQAKDGLVHCIALGADRAVLLTDRALAGSDTLATAPGPGAGIGKREPRPDCLRAQQRRRRDRPGRPRVGRVDGPPPRQPGPRPGLPGRYQHGSSGTRHRRRAPGYPMPPPRSGLRHRRNRPRIVPQPRRNGRRPGTAHR